MPKKPRGVTRERTRTSAARQAWESIFDLAFFSAEAHDRMHGICERAGFTPGLVKAVISPSLASGPVPMRSLAQQWRCDPSYVTMQVRELEQRGLAERRFNPEDHRFKTVALTEKGERVRGDLLDELLEPPGCFSALSATEQRALRDLLHKLVDAMTAERHAAGEMSDAS